MATLAVLAVASIALVSLAACGGHPAPGATPSPSPSGNSTSVPGVPDADVEFLPQSETYPSAWDALGLEPASTRVDMWRVPLDDGSVLSVESREGGGSRVTKVAPGGAATPLTDWLPTDLGQAWDAIAYSDPWLVYADDAGSHADGRASADGVFFANTETGDVTVLEVREYAAPREPCEECGDRAFFTEAAIGREAVHWTVGGPTDLIYERPVRSRRLAGGATTDLIVANIHFDDASCVTATDAEVRVSGLARGQAEDVDQPMSSWDLGPAGATPVSAPGGMTGWASNVEPSTCAGVDVVGWWTRLDGEPLGESIGKATEDDPNVLLSAIDFVGPKGRARVRFDDDFALFGVTSRIDGWAVVEHQPSGSPDPQFLLFDVEGWRLYRVDAPPGMFVTRATASNGRLLAYVGTQPASGGLQGDTLLSASLP